jgi:hypothetical protein
MRILHGLPKMTVTLASNELTKIDFLNVNGVNVINYGKGNVYICEGCEEPNIKQDINGVTNAVLLIPGASNNLLVGGVTGSVVTQTIWLYALSQSMISLQVVCYEKSRIMYGGTGIVDEPLPPKPIVYKLLDGEIPMGNNGEIVGSGMIIDGVDVDFNHLGIVGFAEHSIRFGNTVTFSSDGTGMVVKHIANKQSGALAMSFYDDKGSDNKLYFPHYKKRQLMDLQVDSFDMSIKTPYSFTAESDVTVYGYNIRLDSPAGDDRDNARYSIKLGNCNEYEKNEQVTLAESCYESDWFKNKGEPIEHGHDVITKVELNNGFLLEKGKCYTLYAENYDMFSKERTNINVLGDSNTGVPWSQRDCQPCEIKPIIEGCHYVTGQDMDAIGRKWMENMDYDPPRTTVFNTDIMCYCNLIANRKVKPFFTWYAVMPPTVLSYDEVGGDDFRFLMSLAEDSADVKWAGYNYAYRDDLYCWIPKNFRTIDTESIELGNLRITPPNTQSNTLFLNSNGGWSEPPYPTPPKDTSTVETVMVNTSLLYQSNGNYYVASVNNERQTWEYCVGFTVMCHDTSGKPPNDNKWRNMVMYEWDSASQVIAGRANSGDNTWIKDKMPCRMFITYAKKEDPTPDLNLIVGTVSTTQASDDAVCSFHDTDDIFKNHYSTDRLLTKVWYYKLVAENANTGTRQLTISATNDYGAFTFEAGSTIKVHTSKSSIFVGDTLYLRAQWVKSLSSEQPLMRSMSMSVQEEPVKLGMIDTAIQSVKNFLS